MIIETNFWLDSAEGAVAMTSILSSPDVQTSFRAIIQAAESLVKAGVLSNSLHGNISVRIPGTDTIVLTGRASLASFAEEELAVLDLDGNVLQGRLEPTAHEIVHMHTTPYKLRKDVGSVIHTHSPYATTYAVASKPLECISEAMSRFEMTGPIPVARYAPRGSQEAVQNIASVIDERTKGILLENHGILTMGPDASAAARVVVVMEETAFLGINAAALGGARPIPAHMLHASADRAAEFQRLGTVQGGRATA
jgi:L-fuculose-phosphate aldolase